MDRLTWYDCYDGVYAQGIVQQDYDGATVFTGKPIDRLAEYEDTGLSPAEVAELAQAKADGRLVVLPCKTEDTVFIVYAKKILETTVDKRAWTDDDGYMLRTKEEWFKKKDIGKTIFLTREEAEKALKESDNNV